MPTITATGAEIRRFFYCKDKNVWPEPSYADNVVIKVKGALFTGRVESLADDEIAEMSGTLFTRNGKKHLAQVMSKWRQTHMIQQGTLSIPSKHLDALQAFLQQHNGTLILDQSPIR